MGQVTAVIKPMLCVACETAPESHSLIISAARFRPFADHSATTEAQPLVGIRELRYPTVAGRLR